MPGVKHVFKVTVDVFSTKREGVAVVADIFGMRCKEERL